MNLYWKALHSTPNPANRVLKILPLVTDPNRRKQISVTDLNGSNYDHALKWSGNDLNVEKLANGVYILTIPNLSGEPFRTRFVVQK
ncbi:T9SS type A sorting domain-containing protein [Dyadobacter fermentans]|uniref:T9SS type A sorting domain-containing protein n=1 Tax=Dyadobacter fermentans TaxID=94254 RepID=UPI001CC0A206|nr:T9SS type A sorting domain-containing protein [Dyadobacter fermentans]MBZ1358451.1 T9SS type A sorting domain-containing protein [Dyadobacter fermentans]